MANDRPTVSPTIRDIREQTAPGVDEAVKALFEGAMDVIHNLDLAGDEVPIAVRIFADLVCHQVWHQRDEVLQDVVYGLDRA